MKPLTRKEMFFNYISGKTTSKPKPMTREEKILDEFKPTMVVNIYHSADASSNVATSDKTYTEIMEHYNAGGEVRAVVRKEGYTSIKAILHITHYNDFYVFFSGTVVISNPGDALDSFNSAMIYGVSVSDNETFCAIKSII